MTNQLVGDVYGKIIEKVIDGSSTDFEESGVSQSTLKELQQEWQSKLSARAVAQMPWDAKPEPVQAPPPVSAAPTSTALPPTPYANYDQQLQNGNANGARIKTEAQSENPYGGVPTSNYTGQQGGAARAQYLLQQQYGTAASGSINAMSQQPQQQRGGLALPGQQQQQNAKPQGLHLPQQGQTGGQAQYSQQQQQQMYHQRMQQQQQQAQPRIKTENDSPQLQQGGFQQQPVNYSQTDGAGDDPAMEQWQTMLAERRAAHAAQGHEADRMMRDQVSQMSAELESGLMVPLDSSTARKQRRARKAAQVTASNGASSSDSPTIPQLDGDADDAKVPIKDEDEDAINSDLDDPDDDGQGEMDNEDDDEGDSILCTYDKVQRVKNKWKCTLKDGVMSVNGKEWVFHKGTGEFEW